MPAISSGIFGFPKDRCAKILVGESYGYLDDNPQSSLDVAEFCVFDDDTAGHFRRAFKALGG
jgi:O-acetyl-ADP-ribose deacetylase (regulator of RNase III)